MQVKDDNRIAWENTRAGVADDDAMIQSSSDADTFTMAWTLNEFAADDYRARIEAAIGMKIKDSGAQLFGTDVKFPQEEHWEKARKTIAAFPGDVEFIRLGSSPSNDPSSFLHLVTSDVRAVAVVIEKNAKLPNSYFYMLLRLAFNATAHKSIEAEFNWALKPFTA
ncbi:MAG: hypothetical protein NVS3B29_06950 [Candidatus Saccharimonadales bacterium]